METERYIVDLSRNPGTGRNGQINTIFVKDGGVLLTRARPTSTLHLSPNAAVARQWVGINRWDPPAKHQVERDAAAFRLDREGEMPNVPQLRVKVTYRFEARSSDILVEESIEATEEAHVALLRLCEWSFAPGAGNLFSHVAWEEPGGNVVTRRKEREETLPLRIRWMGLYSEVKRLSFVAVIDSLEGGLLAGESARFGGDPHYFYRVLVAAEPGKQVKIPKGARYETRYRVRCFRPQDPAHPFRELKQ